MKSHRMIARTFVGLAVALVLGAGAAGVAAADVTATGGDGTVVDADGTQGKLAPAVQGNQDDDGDQDAFLTGSAKATPQFKAAPK